MNNVQIPNASFVIKNAIYGVYQDIDFASGVGSINYKVFGTYPNRTFVMNVSGVPQWPNSQNAANKQTTQIVLYETTNIIDILVKRRVPGIGNGGWPQGVLGIQNNAGTKAAYPGMPGSPVGMPNRNTGTWSATNEAYRFTPSGVGPENVSFVWKNQAGEIISQGSGVAFSTLEVCPQFDQSYSVQATFTRCDGTTVSTAPDSYFLQIAPPLPVLDPKNITVCSNVFPTTVNLNQNTYILNGADPLDYDIRYYTNATGAALGNSNGLLTPAQVASFPILNGDPVTIYVYLEAVGVQCINVRPFVVQVGTPGGSFSYPDADGDIPSKYCFNSNAGIAPTLNTLTAGGTFTVNPPTGLTINPNTGVINLTCAVPGTYTINYDIAANPAPGGCPAFNRSTTVIIESCFVATVSNSGNVCQGTSSFNLFTNYNETVCTPATTYKWTDNAGVQISTDKNPVGVAVPTAAGTYVYSLVITQNGVASSPYQTTLIVHPLPTANFVSVPATICTNASTTLLFSGSPAGALIDFTDGTNNYSVTLDASGNGTFLTPNLATNTTFTLVKATGTTTPACEKSLSESIIISVGLPTAQIVKFTNTVICSGTATGLEITGTPGATVTYTKDGVTQPTVIVPTSGALTIDTGNLNGGSYVYALTNIVSNSTPPCSDTITGQSATLTVNALPTATIATSTATICTGTAATLTFTGTPNATVTYNNGTTDLTTTLDASGTKTVTTALLTANTTFTLVKVEVTNTVLCGQPQTGSVTIAINANVAITNTLVGGTICAGASKTFTITATGQGLMYQWYKNGTLITGATNDTYTIASPVATDAGDYTVVVSGSCGPAQTSNTATLIISQATVITTPPQAATTVCVGQAINLSVTATGTVLTYQWYKGTTAIAGATNSTFNIASATTTDAGTYHVVITNSCGVATPSSDAVITVNELPKITTSPTGTTICEGQSINLSVAATGTNITYQWFRNNTAIAGATSANYSDTSVTLAEAGNYTVTVSGACTPAVTSAIAQIVVNPGATFTVQPPTTRTVCSGTEVKFTVGTTPGVTVTYQWFKGTTAITGATASTYTIASSTPADTGSYTCVVTVPSCGPMTSTASALTVNQAPAITSQPEDKNICVGKPAAFTVVATGTNLTYQWFKAGIAIAGATSSTYSLASATQANNGGYYCVITSASCPPITTNTVNLTARPLPTATISNGTKSTICSGESNEIVFNGTPGAVVIYTINGGAPETVELDPAGGPTVVATGTLTQNTVYTLVSVTYTGVDACSQTLTGSVTIKVNPLPVVTLQDGFICIDPVTLAVTRSYLLNTGLDQAKYTFKWFDQNGQIPFASNSYYEANAVGQYSVTIRDIVTGCESSAFANVEASSPPTDFTYTVSGFFADNPTLVITATPVGQYEYQLDYGPFQQSNVFDNISAGTHSITVRDEQACDVLTKSVLVVDYPRYFTPNGDGINDTWNIPSISGISFTKIYIFDRFGKLVKEMTATSAGSGWDGTLNGQDLPATDYWFTINYEEAGINKEFKAHFSLKR